MSVFRSVPWTARIVWEEATVAFLTVEAASLSGSAASWSESAKAWMFRSLFTNLCGITFDDWWRVLRANRFAIAPGALHRAALVTAGSVLNSWYRRGEEKTFGARLDGIRVPPPLFVLGHWRSGTTLLHNLLALDDRFAFPNLYEVFFPHTFLATEDQRTGLVAPLIPRTRAFDNVAQGLDMPNEDEFATAAASLCSPYLWWAFPRNAATYERYLTFRDAPSVEVERWKSALLRFLQKMTLRYERPLLLKSPPHTARVGLLRTMFPDAKFVHVHRDPCTVFRSTRHLNDVLTKSLGFQSPLPSDRDDAVIRRYRAMHDAYFDDRADVPEGHLHELAFHDLERDPIGAIRGVYQALDLPGFADVRPRIQHHLDGLSDYRKNVYPSLDPDLNRRLRSEWGRSFEEWGYSIG